MSGPQCPSWCTKDHGEARGTGAGVHASEVRWTRDGRDPLVSIHQAPGGRAALYFGGVRVDLLDAGLLASAMERLGHPDVAAMITEVAALADNAEGGDS